MWSSTSTAFLSALRAENSEAWTRFLERYGPLIYEICRQRGVPADDARDLVQEVLMGVHRILSRTLKSDADVNFHAWLRGIVRFKLDLRCGIKVTIHSAEPGCFPQAAQYRKRRDRNVTFCRTQSHARRKAECWGCSAGGGRVAVNCSDD